MACNLKEFSLAFNTAMDLENAFEAIEEARCKTCNTLEEFRDALKDEDYIMDGFADFWYSYMHGGD